MLLVLVLLIVRIPEAANKKQKTATKKSKARHALVVSVAGKPDSRPQ